MEVCRRTPVSMVGLCYVGVGRDENSVIHYVPGCDFIGEANLEKPLKRGLETLIEEVDRSISACQLPPQDPDLDASYVAYNMTGDPLGFDFVVWLVAMEMRRVREGAPAPLKVGFHERSDGRKLAPDQEGWLDNVFRPALKLIGAVERPAACYGYRTGCFVHVPIIEASLRGEKVPILRSTMNIEPIFRGMITITLRESSHWPHRNSDLVEWEKIAAALRSRGEHVIVVRDTAQWAIDILSPKHSDTLPPSIARSRLSHGAL